MYPDTTISQLQLVHPVVDFFESTYLVVQWHIVFEKKKPEATAAQRSIGLCSLPLLLPPSPITLFPSLCSTPLVCHFDSSSFPPPPPFFMTVRVQRQIIRARCQSILTP